MVFELHDANESALDGLTEILLDLPLETLAAVALLIPKEADILCPFDFEANGYALDDFVVYDIWLGFALGV